MTRQVVGAAIVVWCTAGPAGAHQPLFSDGTESSYEQALSIEDVGLSQVVYGELTAALPRLHMTFEGRAGDNLYLQIGLPRIDRLSAYRPAVAVIGPGLPAGDPGFALPAGMGVSIVDPAEVAQPEEFHEPFTNTYSWILKEAEFPLPASGKYYLVAYSPGGQTGKLWVAVGKREEFGFEDFARFGDIVAEVQAFHEVEPGTAPPCFLLPAGMMLMLTVAWKFIRRGGRWSCAGEKV